MGSAGGVAWLVLVRCLAGEGTGLVAFCDWEFERNEQKI